MARLDEARGDGVNVREGYGFLATIHCDYGDRVNRYGRNTTLACSSAVRVPINRLRAHANVPQLCLGGFRSHADDGAVHFRGFFWYYRVAVCVGGGILVGGRRNDPRAVFARQDVLAFVIFVFVFWLLRSDFTWRAVPLAVGGSGLLSLLILTFFRDLAGGIRLVVRCLTITRANDHVRWLVDVRVGLRSVILRLFLLKLLHCLQFQRFFLRWYVFCVVYQGGRLFCQGVVFRCVMGG